MNVHPTKTPTLRRHRHQRVLAAVIIAVLVAGVAGVVGWRLHEQRDIRVGDRFDAVTVFEGQTTEQRVRLPIAFGTLSVTVGAGHEVGAHDDRVVAPAGATMVEVSWASATGDPTPAVWPGASARDRRDPGADLTLVTGGRRYPIASEVTAADEGGSGVVVVQGDGSDARVESRVQGHVFTSVAESSTARRAHAEGYAGCDDTAPKTYSWVECDLPAYRAGYVAGLGAAPVGKEWLVVSGASVRRSERRVSVYGGDDENAEYFPSGAPTVTFTVDGISGRPRQAGRDEVIEDAVRPADRAWLVDADRSSTVRLRYRLPTKIDRSQSDWPGAPATHEVDVSTTTTYPGA